MSDLPEDEDDGATRCFGCGGEISAELEVWVSEPCPDILGNSHAWHITCYICFKQHGAFPNMPRCKAEADA